MVVLASAELAMPLDHWGRQLLIGCDLGDSMRLSLRPGVGHAVWPFVCLSAQQVGNAPW